MLHLMKYRSVLQFYSNVYLTFNIPHGVRLRTIGWTFLKGGESLRSYISFVSFGSVKEMHLCSSKQ